MKAIADRLPASDYRFSALVLEIVNSLPFQSRRRTESHHAVNTRDAMIMTGDICRDGRS